MTEANELHHKQTNKSLKKAVFIFCHQVYENFLWEFYF